MVAKLIGRLNNLCMATRIHILEPQWNPTVESQAIGRLFRHGQTNKVHITRYICQNTIEEVSAVKFISNSVSINLLTSKCRLLRADSLERSKLHTVEA